MKQQFRPPLLVMLRIARWGRRKELLVASVPRQDKGAVEQTIHEGYLAQHGTVGWKTHRNKTIMDTYRR